jgi:glycosyltransferase involved in cell wall biosynthesis
MSGSRTVVHMTSAHDATDTRIFAKECRTLAAVGFDVHLVAPNAGNETNHGVRIHAVAPPHSADRSARMSRTVFDVHRLARGLEADLYHFHDPELMPAGLLLARSGVPVVYDAHEDLAATVLDKAWIRKRLRRPLARLIADVEPSAANRLAAVVAATPAIAAGFSGCRCEVVTVNNFPELGEFRHVERSDAGQEPAVCFVGAITAIRGIEVMVEAVAKTDARLLLAGEFESQRLADRLRAVPGWSRVEYVGPVGRAEVAEVFARASAGVVVFAPLANHIRAQPTKLFEYMSAGLPVVASNFPLWRDIVEGADCGICVDPLDGEALARAIRWLVAHPEEARDLGENGRRAVADTYNWAHEGLKLTALYKRLLP